MNTEIVFDKVDVFCWYVPKKGVVSNFSPLLNVNHLVMGIYGNDFYCIGYVVNGTTRTSKKFPLEGYNTILKTRFNETQIRGRNKGR